MSVMATPAVSERRLVSPIPLALAYGSAGVLILTLEPLVFGPLVASGVLGESQLGVIASLETGALGLASVLLPGMLSRGDMRRNMASCAAVMILCNLLTPLATAIFPVLCLLRIVCGLAEGGMLAGAFVILFAGRDPDRMNALFLAASNTITAILAWMLPTYVGPRLGVAGGFLLMAVAGVVALASLVPLRHVPDPMVAPVTGWRGWPSATFLVLLAIVVQNAAVMASWTFIESAVREARLGPSVLASATSLGIVAQVLGAGFVAGVGYRLPCGRMLVAGSLVLAGSILWIGHASSVASFVAANMVMGFCWLALLPISIRLVCEIERRRQAVYLTAAAQMAGLSLGPLLAATVVGPGSVAAAYTLGAGLGIGAMLLFLAAARSSARSSLEAQS